MSTKLQCGVLTGPALERDVSGVPHLTRALTWSGTVPRAALHRPFQLQDPQLVFAVYDEPAVT